MKPTKSFTILLLFLFSIETFAQTAISKVEPPNWWVGMKDSCLQIMVTGQNLSDAIPEIKYKGVRIDSVKKGDSPNYLFINLNISKKTIPGNFDITFTKGKQTFNCPYSLNMRIPNSSEIEGFSNKDVMYLLMPDRFANGDPKNDTTPETVDGIDRLNEFGRHGGDIQGITNHLDYIKELGVTAVWSTPVLEDNCETGSYHGYAITDFYRVDPRYGSNEIYRTMVDECHNKGLKVVMDMISNHCGSAHYWTHDPPFKDWLHFDKMEEKFYHNKRAFNDPHVSENDLDLVMNGTFDKWVPDLNQKNPFLLKYFIQNSIWWIEFSRINGIRMDTYMYNDHAAMARWAKAVMDEYPNFNIVGENWLFETHQIAYWQRNSINPTGYQSNLKTVMDFSLYYAIQQCFNEQNYTPKDGEESGITRLYNVLSNDYLYADLNNILVFSENHDTPRMNQIIGGDINKFKMIMAFLATTRGIPQLYYGSEIMMTGDKSKGDGDIRRDFPGGWNGDKYNCFSAEGRNSLQNESFNYLKNLLNWRKNKEVIHTGKLIHYVPRDGVYVYFRTNSRESVMIILNNNNKKTILDTNRFYHELSGFTNGFEITSSTLIDDLSMIPLDEKSVKIIELK